MNMLQLALFLIIFFILVIPVGKYLYLVASGKKTFADPVFDRVDHVIYRLAFVDEKKNMDWKQYAVSLIATNAVMVFICYLVLIMQKYLFLNPNGIGNMSGDLSFNTVISFMTNTNLQHYSGESGLSYLSQMIVITFMMFTSAASGYAACIAFVRGIVGRGKDGLGNFFVDLVRVTTRVLIPFASIVAILLVLQGVPQNLHQNITLETIEGTEQQIAMGPVATLESIKHVGTNGGGFLGANSSTPIENPTIVSNMIEMLSMMVLPAACVVMFGLMYEDSRKERGLCSKGRIMGMEGRTLFAAMAIIFLLGLLLCVFSERSGNPLFGDLGMTQQGNMEGKEVRFGVDQSALFTTVTTSFTTGSVNNMHDSLTPLGGLVPLLHMMLNLVFGGKGVGLMNIVMYVILTVFICSLMVGRTPEYLGKKIEGKEMKLTALCIIIHPLLILFFSAVAVAVDAGLAGITNPGFHGLSQVLYEYSSASANNGSGFEGLADASVFWNITTGFAMFFGRYLAIVIQLAIAGNLAKKNYVNESEGTLKTNTTTFTIALVFIIYVFAALTFFPALALGPIAEHLMIWA